MQRKVRPFPYSHRVPRDVNLDSRSQPARQGDEPTKDIMWSAWSESSKPGVRLRTAQSGRGQLQKVLGCRGVALDRICAVTDVYASPEGRSREWPYSPTQYQAKFLNAICELGLGACPTATKSPADFKARQLILRLFAIDRCSSEQSDFLALPSALAQHVFIIGAHLVDVFSAELERLRHIAVIRRRDLTQHEAKSRTPMQIRTAHRAIWSEYFRSGTRPTATMAQRFGFSRPATTSAEIKQNQDISFLLPVKSSSKTAGSIAVDHCLGVSSTGQFDPFDLRLWDRQRGGRRTFDQLADRLLSSSMGAPRIQGTSMSGGLGILVARLPRRTGHGSQRHVTAAITLDDFISVTKSGCEWLS